MKTKVRHSHFFWGGKVDGGMIGAQQTPKEVRRGLLDTLTTKKDAKKVAGVQEGTKLAIREMASSQYELSELSSMNYRRIPLSESN